MRTILIASVFATVAQAGCVAVSSDKILVRDVGEAWPFLQVIDPETPIGFAPRPGVQRVLSIRELILFAHAHGLEPGNEAIPSICVERVVRPISPEEMRAAILSTIGATDIDLEVLEFSREPLPPGRLEFRSVQLGRPPGENPDIPVIWRGILHYDSQSSLSVWAKIKVSVGCIFLVAAEDVPAGTLITAAQVKEVPGRQPPFPTSPIQTSPSIIGKVARRNIRAGQRFPADALEEPNEISKGDMVHVLVVDGTAILSLDAVAQSSGKKGDGVLLHNPATGKNFRGLIEAKGKATVRSSPGV